MPAIHSRGFKCVLVAGCTVAFVAGSAATGAAFLFSPATTPDASPWVRVIDLASLPADGRPQRYGLSVEQRDAWTRLPDRFLGFVYLRRTRDSQGVIALRGSRRSAARWSTTPRRTSSTNRAGDRGMTPTGGA